MGIYGPGFSKADWLNQSYNKSILLTNCKVHTRKYLDRSFEVRTERSEVRTKS